MNRRSFLKATAGVAGTGIMDGAIAPGEAGEASARKMNPAPAPAQTPATPPSNGGVGGPSDHPSSLGDMGCHVLNTPWRALELGAPLSIEAYSRNCTKETGPVASIVNYEFPARGDKPPVQLTWHEGGLMPPLPVELTDGRRLGDNEGVIFVGEKGKITRSCYGENVRLLPDELHRSYRRPPNRIPRSPGVYGEWLAACKGGPQAGSHFERAAVLTEMVQLGNVAIRYSAKVDKELQNGRSVKLMWDAMAGKTSQPEADQFLRTEYRKGWEI